MDFSAPIRHGRKGGLQTGMTSEPEQSDLQRYHLQCGWVVLGFFLTMGLVLETLHGLKMDWYLNVGLENRRLLITLAHAHGALIGILHLAFSATMPQMQLGTALRWSSWCLLSATILRPGGFLLGGIFLLGSDPGWGVFLTPLGGLLLITAVLLAFRATIR